MMKLLSDLYNVTLKRGIEGAAKGGFVRPTIGENFMSHKDFQEIESRKGWTNRELMSDYMTNGSNSAYIVDEDIPIISVTRSNSLALAKPMELNSGKWYWEVKQLEGNSAFAMGVSSSNLDSAHWKYNVGIGNIVSLMLDTYEQELLFWVNGTPSSANYSTYNMQDTSYIWFGIGGNYTSATCQAYFSPESFNFPELFESTNAEPFNKVGWI